MNNNTPVLEMRGISKEFPGVKALDSVDLKAWSGQVLALVGENGAGKSTLMKVLSGVWPYPEYQGELLVRGTVRRFTHTHDAEAAGIAIIYQELNLIYGMTVAENIYLGHLPRTRWGTLDWHRMNSDARSLLHSLHLDSIQPDDMINDLSVGQQQMVEIAKALSQKADILILDEPTSALSDRETKELFSVIRKLKSEGVAMIYISHKMDEISEIADQVQVLRDGRNIGEAVPVKNMTMNEIISRMVGRDISTMYPRGEKKIGPVCLQISDITLPHPHLTERKLLDSISFEARQGEILGIAGLMGSGRTELVSAIFGAWAGPKSGEVRLDGKKLLIRNPKDAIKAGLALVTEDRKLQGLLLEQDLIFNTTLASLDSLTRGIVLDTSREKDITEKFQNKLGTKAPSLYNPVKTLSGGNQQKVVIAKWLATSPRVLILDEPTRGIDIGAKVEIYKLMNQLAAEGMCIIMISSELPEILGMSDRILVMHEGHLTGTLDRKQASEEKIMALATGQK